MINNIWKFGVRQRCMEGNMNIVDFLLRNLHFEKQENFYIYEDDYIFLGIVNGGAIIKEEFSAEKCEKTLLRDVCVKNEKVVFWSETEDLSRLLDTFFKNNLENETAVIEKTSHKIIGVINRGEFYNEILEYRAEKENEFLCYRSASHQYFPKTKGFGKFAYNINSQHGEDGILNAIFNKIGTTSKYAVEFGGWDGIYLSNIRNLIMEQDFSGLFIEGEEERAAHLLENYKGNPKVQCEAAYVGFRGENTLDNILERNHAPKEIDLLSIDIDGYDYHVWESLKNYKPRVVIIEYNPSIPNEIMFVNPRNESLFTGSSAAAIVELGRKKGYSLIAVTQTNLIFTVNEEYNKFEIWDNSLEVLRPADRLSDGKYFQTYEGTIIFTGFNSYIWSGNPFGSGTQKYIYTNV